MSITFDYTGKNVLITGAATGIGRTTALMFADAGANIAIWDVNEEKCREVLDACTEKGVTTRFYKADVSDEAMINDVAAKTLADFGYIDFLISNAGIAPTGDYPLYRPGFIDDFRKILEINTLGFAIVLQSLLPNFMSRNEGKIVVTSSVSYKISSSLLPHYAASKAGVSSLVRNAALMLGKHNVNVNAISPGFVYTYIYHTADVAIKGKVPQVFQDCETSEQVMEKMASNSALGRKQTTEDMANTILFLCSEEAKNITGEDINIDAGRAVM